MTTLNSFQSFPFPFPLHYGNSWEWYLYSHSSRTEGAKSPLKDSSPRPSLPPAPPTPSTHYHFESLLLGLFWISLKDLTRTPSTKLFCVWPRLLIFFLASLLESGGSFLPFTLFFFFSVGDLNETAFFPDFLSEKRNIICIIWYALFVRVAQHTHTHTHTRTHTHTYTRRYLKARDYSPPRLASPLLYRSAAV